MSQVELQPNEFQCALCKAVFEKGVSDKEAVEEQERIFGKVPEEEIEVVCHGCWCKMMAWERAWERVSRQ